jgi:hypothetical protein
MIGGIVEAGGESLVPLVASPQTVSEQDPDRPGALGSQIRYVHGDQLPGNVARRVVGKEVDALDHHVVGQDQLGIADAEHRCVVKQFPGGGLRGQAAERRNEVRLGRHQAVIHNSGASEAGGRV